MYENRLQRDDGFSLVEIMSVLLILGVIVAIAIPLYISVTAKAAQRTCWENQHMLERTVETYLGTDITRNRADLVGLIDGDHPLVVENLIGLPPLCPSAPKPTDRRHPTSAEGAYTYDAMGSIEPCTHGMTGPHGHF